MRFISFLIMVLALCSKLSGQGNQVLKELLAEAESVLYSEPEETVKVAAYITTKTEDLQILATANLLAAEASFITGSMEDAVFYTFHAYRFATHNEDAELKARTAVLTAGVFRHLRLDTLSGIFIQEAKNLLPRINNSQVRIEIELNQIQNLIESQQIRQALQSLKTIEEKTAEDETGIKNRIDLLYADLFLKEKKPDSSMFFSNRILERDKSLDFLFYDIVALNRIGEVYFLKKDFQKAKNYFNNSLNLADKLPARYFVDLNYQGLLLSHLALEENNSFLEIKLKQNQTAVELTGDRNAAINSVYNFINQFQKEELASFRLIERQKTFSLAAVILFLLISGILFNYFLNLKLAQYRAISKYIKPGIPKIEVEKPVAEIKRSTLVPEEIERSLLEKLQDFESGEDFIQPEMSIALLASNLDTNTKYLSEIINRQKGKNFNSYINELRINYIIDKLKTDPVFSQYKISYLAEITGFSSHSSFTTVFKSITGVSPKAFIDLLNKQAKKHD